MVSFEIRVDDSAISRFSSELWVYLDLETAEQYAILLLFTYAVQNEHDGICSLLWMLWNLNFADYEL